MKSLRLRSVLVLAVLSCLPAFSFASAYNGRPRLVVVIVIDQFRGDYLERYSDEFGEGGLRLFLDHGANFTDCNYNFATTRTGPAHATLFTGAYPNAHGIISNEWWDPAKKRMVTSVEDDSTHLVGVSGNAVGASPHNLHSDTLGDELKLATKGKSRVFAISLKDRAAILPGGFAANGAYWVDHKTGAWVTSTYYRGELPRWALAFNEGKHAEKYLNRDWTDSNGKVLRSTRLDPAKPEDFSELVGSTPFGNDYELDFARELMTDEKLGSGPTTDLLLLSLSANDILGHQVGPDSPLMESMAVALDHQLADFFSFLGKQIGLANVWIALSADHGVAPLYDVAAKLHLPASYHAAAEARASLNRSLSSRLSPGHPLEYVKDFDFYFAWLNQDAFGAIKMKEEDAEAAVGEAMKSVGLRAYYTRSQLAAGNVPNTAIGLKYLHSYAPLPAWYVMGVPPPFFLSSKEGTDHGSPYTYDTHVPLVFYGLPFQAGTYRTHAEPVDLATTLASLLGINAPTHAIGRVLTEALAPPHRENSGNPSGAAPTPAPSPPEPYPAAAIGHE